MNTVVKLIDRSEMEYWDSYVLSHPAGHLYHLSGWSNIISETYGHKFYYLVALRMNSNSKSDDKKSNMHMAQVVGILPLIHIKHFLFGNNMTSVPFFDMGGVLADDTDIEKALVEKAISLSESNKIDSIDLRQTEKLNYKKNRDISNLSVSVSCHKVRMLLNLPESSEKLEKSFKSKLRSQIKKPYKSGLSIKSGWLELLDDFYSVFVHNMRDLGSPVHSKRLIENVINKYRNKTRIFVVYKGNKPVAASVVVGHKGTLHNPWSSSLREYGRLSPNMMLYWKMLEYACDKGYKVFDFGRSTPGEGTYRFKVQWGAEAQQLYWYTILLNGKNEKQSSDQKSKFDIAVEYWQKLPVPITEIMGPMIRKYISL